MKAAILAALAATAIAGAGPAAAAAPNLLNNGDFEQSIGNVSDGGYATVGAGAGTITGWTVGATSVDLIRNNYGAINSVSVDLGGSPGPGSLTQSFATTVGQTYRLDFDYFVNGGGFPLYVSFGTNNATYSVVPSSATHAFQTMTANSSSSSVSFTHTFAGNSGPVIDNVSVTAVPEPESYAMLMAGLGALGFMSRRRARKQA